MVCLDPDCGERPREGWAGTEEETEGGQEEAGGGGDKKEGGAPCRLRVLKGRRHPQEFNWPLRAVYLLDAVVSLPVWPR